MSNLPNSVIRLVPPTLRGGYCPDSWQEFANELVCGTQAQHGGERGTTFYNFGNTAPYPPAPIPEPPVEALCSLQDFGYEWEPANFQLDQYALFYSDPTDPEIGGVTRISLCATEYKDIGFYETFRFRGISTLEEFHVPNATSIGQQLWLQECPLLTKVSIPLMTTLTDFILIRDNPLLTEISCPLLAAGGAFFCPSNASLASLSFPSLVTSGSMQFHDCAALTSFSAPLWTPSTNIRFDGCALDETSVDHILERAVAGTIGTIFANPKRTIKLEGGTNATPSAAGLANKATLNARPFLIVTTN